MGKTLILLGILLVLAGIVINAGVRIPWLGKLPGDLLIKKENATFYFPVTTCVLVSIVLTIVMHLFKK